MHSLRSPYLIALALALWATPASTQAPAPSAPQNACLPTAGNATVTVLGDMDCKGLTLSQSCGVMGATGPLFILEDGARLSNVTLINSYVSCEGTCSLRNVHWRNHCPAAILPNAVIQSLNPSGPKTISVSGGTALGRFGALFQLNTPGSTLLLRRFGFSGSAISLNGFTPDLSSDLRFRLEDVTVAGSLSGGVVRVRPLKRDMASISRLRIYGYRPLEPAVCMTVFSDHSGDLHLGEAWDSSTCGVRPEDVEAVPL